MANLANILKKKHLVNFLHSKSVEKFSIKVRQKIFNQGLIEKIFITVCLKNFNQGLTTCSFESPAEKLREFYVGCWIGV